MTIICIRFDRCSFWNKVYLYIYSNNYSNRNSSTKTSSISQRFPNCALPWGPRQLLLKRGQVKMLRNAGISSYISFAWRSQKLLINRISAKCSVCVDVRRKHWTFLTSSWRLSKLNCQRHLRSQLIKCGLTTSLCHCDWISIYVV